MIFQQLAFSKRKGFAALFDETLGGRRLDIGRIKIAPMFQSLGYTATLLTYGVSGLEMRMTVADRVTVELRFMAPYCRTCQ